MNEPVYTYPVRSFEGRCQCGNVQYRITGEAATLFACHCTDCQRQSSSAFGMALWVRHPKIELLNGNLSKWTRTTPTGTDMICSFCSTCGTRLFHQKQGQSDFLSIKPGTLNDTKKLKPVGHIWTSSKQRWFPMQDAALQYLENPPNFDKLMSFLIEEIK